MEISCAAILFDMDGVLIDSTPAVARVWSRWAQERSFDPATVVQMAHGRPSLSTIRDLLPDADHEAENREVERREIADLEGVVPLPGARQLLASLSAQRYAIVTSSTRRLAEARLHAAGLPLPKFFVTSSDIENGKPHPEPYLKAATKLGVDPKQCVVVEDVPSGIRAGARVSYHRSGRRAARRRRRLGRAELREHLSARGRGWPTAPLPGVERTAASNRLPSHRRRIAAKDLI
jgi:sugar-phosphatase